MQSEVLKDAGMKRAGIKSKQQQRTAEAHFSDFLRLHEDAASAASRLTKFRRSTSLPSFSGGEQAQRDTVLHQPGERLHPNNTIDQSYADLRAGIRKLFVTKAIEGGEALADHASLLYADPLRVICQTSSFTTLRHR
ncbi:hypothetical protein PybrP1_007374 [[Pythium] brassicae (nom. inval.)]|nr:hypothetical protein PybrP1_007374 [[Pythium] brassicae (nom. inval.)]